MIAPRVNAGPLGRSDPWRHPACRETREYRLLVEGTQLRGDLTADLLSEKEDVVREMYERLCDREPAPALALAPLRDEYEAFVLGEVVERL